LLTVTVFAVLIGIGFFLRSQMREKEPQAEMTEEQIKQKWRELGFFCELDDGRKIWTLTGSRAGLLFFPDILLGYVADPANATDGNHRNYGPYGSLEIMTWPEAGFDSHAIRGSLAALAHLADLVGAKLAFAEPGSPIMIREEFAPESRYTLLLDVRADGFDPASTDRERLGATAAPVRKRPEPGATPSK
jgi:hypothetical protein